MSTILSFFFFFAPKTCGNNSFYMESFYNSIGSKSKYSELKKQSENETKERGHIIYKQNSNDKNVTSWKGNKNPAWFCSEGTQSDGWTVGYDSETVVPSCAARMQMAESMSCQWSSRSLAEATALILQYRILRRECKRPSLHKS